MKATNPTARRKNRKSATAYAASVPGGDHLVVVWYGLLPPSKVVSAKRAAAVVGKRPVVYIDANQIDEFNSLMEGRTWAA